MGCNMPIKINNSPQSVAEKGNGCGNGCEKIGYFLYLISFKKVINLHQKITKNLKQYEYNLNARPRAFH